MTDTLEQPGPNGKPKLDKHGRPVPQALIDHAFKPGNSGNAKGKEKDGKTYARMAKQIKQHAADRYEWSRRICKKLQLTDDDAKSMTIGELLVHASLLQACTGKSRYLVEINDRCEGKVEDRVKHTGTVGVGIAVAMFPVEPPEGWYEDVRKMIGHRPGDPLLPGEVVIDGEAREEP